MVKFPYIWMMVNSKISLVESQCLPFRSIRSQMFLNIDFLKSYEIFAEKHLRWSLFLIKFQSFRAATLLKKLKKVFSCYQISKGNFFHITLSVAAYALYHYFLKLLLGRSFSYSKQRPYS